MLPVYIIISRATNETKHLGGGLPKSLIDKLKWSLGLIKT